MFLSYISLRIYPLFCYKCTTPRNSYSACIREFSTATTFLAKKPIEFSTLAHGSGTKFSTKYFLSIESINIFSNFILFYIILLVMKIPPPQIIWELFFPFHQKLLRSIISHPGKNNWPDPIFSQLANVWISTGPVQYLRKSSAPKFRTLNMGSAKWGSVKSRRYCMWT
jgi:hypothetical protein